MSAEDLLRWAVKHLPTSRSEYGEVLLTELAALPPSERRRWLLDVELSYPMSPPGWAGALSLLLLLVRAFGAAYTGAVLRHALRRRW